MNNAPKSVIIYTLLCLTLLGCQDRTGESEKQKIDQKIETPEVKEQDSSKLREHIEPSFPDARHPDRMKKKSTDQLDTLRPVKA